MLLLLWLQRCFYIFLSLLENRDYSSLNNYYIDGLGISIISSLSIDL